MKDNEKKYEKPEFEVICDDDPIISSSDDPSNDGWGPLL